MRSYFGTLDTVGHFNDASIHLHCNHNITYAKPANKKMYCHCLHQIQSSQFHSLSFSLTQIEKRPQHTCDLKLFVFTNFFYRVFSEFVFIPSGLSKIK